MTALEPASLRKIAELSPHPRQYRSHPAEQIEHLMHSIVENGFYRNIVISSDDYILGGHGAVEALIRLERTEVTAFQVEWPHDHPKALKILAADNYLSHFAEDDDRMLTELLRQIHEDDELFGTGFDEQMLAAYAMVTRTSDEIGDFDEAAEWAGMPAYDPGGKEYSLMIVFPDEQKRSEYVAASDLQMAVQKEGKQTWSAVWPPEEGRDDLSALEWSTE